MSRDVALLAGGYAIAVPLLFRFNRIVRDRRLVTLAGLELGQAMIAAGWLLRGRSVPAAVNGAALLAYPAWYLARRR